MMFFDRRKKPEWRSRKRPNGSLKWKADFCVHPTVYAQVEATFFEGEWHLTMFGDERLETVAKDRDDGWRKLVAMYRRRLRKAEALRAENPDNSPPAP